MHPQDSNMVPMIIDSDFDAISWAAVLGAGHVVLHGAGRLSVRQSTLEVRVGQAQSLQVKSIVFLCG